MKIKWKLISLDPSVEKEIVLLRPIYTVGRRRDADIPSSYISISRNHAKFLVFENGLFVEDEKSSNGTYINGSRVKSNTQKELKNGDLVTFGWSEQITKPLKNQIDTEVDYMRYRVQEVEDQAQDVIEILDDSQSDSQKPQEIKTEVKQEFINLSVKIESDEKENAPTTCGDSFNMKTVLSVNVKQEKLTNGAVFENNEPLNNESDNLLLDEELEVVHEEPSNIFEYSKVDEFIEISDDEDDNGMFACSQLIKLDQIKKEIKSEPVDPLSNCKEIIKNFEELNYLNDLIRREDEIIEIDYYEDNDALLNTLELTQNSIPNNPQPNAETEKNHNNCNALEEPESNKKTNKYTKPPIVEPHFKTPGTRKAHPPKRKSLDDTTKASDSKKLKLLASKPLRSSNKRTDSLEKELIKKIKSDRKEKLKELSSAKNKSSSDSKNGKNCTKVKVKVSDSRGQFLLDEPPQPSTSTTKRSTERVKNGKKAIEKPDKITLLPPEKVSARRKSQVCYENNNFNNYHANSPNIQPSFSPASDTGSPENCSSRPSTSTTKHSLERFKNGKKTVEKSDNKTHLPPEKDSTRKEQQVRYENSNLNNHHTNSLNIQPSFSPASESGSLENCSDDSNNFRKQICGSRNVKRLNAFLNVNFYNSTVLKNMVGWHFNWLLEQKSNPQQCPPVCDQPIQKIPDFFKSYKEYSSVISGLVLLEIWQFAFDIWNNNNSSYFQATIVHKRIVGNLLYVDCEAFGSKLNTASMREHSLLLLEAKVKMDDRIFLKMKFALVTKAIVDYIKNFDGTMKRRLAFTLVMKHSETEVMKCDKILVQVITNILYYSRLVKTIKCLEFSPLLKLILHPQPESYKISAPLPLSNLNYGTKLNKAQSLIVEEAVHVCTRERPGFYLIQGPPGTGKSTVIVNIVLRILLESKKKPRILLTAPSNAAVDELIMKVNSAKCSLEGAPRKNVKLVRVGPYNSIHANVKPYSLHDHTQRQIMAKFRAEDQRINGIYNGLVAQKTRLLAQLNEAKEKPGLSKANLENKLREIDNDLNPDNFLLKYVEKSTYSYYWKNEQNFILTNCNIVCTTLNSCVNRNIEFVMSSLTASGEPFSFDCCIIDEATQCTEVDALTPLQLGIEKFVLVGDPQQLPATVLSQEAKKFDYGKSLFTRIAANLNDGNHNLIRTLDTQYRMHPEICMFPSNYFYDGCLVSSYSERNKIVPELVPYLVYNIKTQGNDIVTQQYQNNMEIIFVRNMVDILVKTIKKTCKYSIGVITPYTLQKEAIIGELSKVNTNSENVSITVNTVDSFQGQEKDIIIISLVRNTPNQFLEHHQRLNVALTRAKQAVFVIGTYELFKHCNILYDLREDAKKRQLCRDVPNIENYLKNISKDLFKL